MQISMLSNVQLKTIQEGREYVFVVPTGSQVDEALVILDAFKEALVNFKETNTVKEQEVKDGAQEESSNEEVNV